MNHSLHQHKFDLFDLFNPWHLFVNNLSLKAGLLVAFVIPLFKKNGEKTPGAYVRN